ncbi:MAG: SCO family protein [Acidobacteriota bacterium]
MTHPAALLILDILIVSAAACSSGPPPSVREYPLTGQILSIKADRTEVTIRHDDVPGFMAAMTMPFAIKEPKLLEGLQPGDLVRATLVITDEESYLSTVEKTGHAPLTRRGAAEPSPVVADLLMAGEPVPDLALTCDDGATRRVRGYRGSLLLITFIYTRCPLPEFCPRMDAYFSQVQASIKRQPALRKSVRLLSISFDPDFDTPQVLKTHAARVGADPAVWHYGTAPRAEVGAFGAHFGLSVLREGEDGSNISHNLRTVLVGRDGTLAKTYNGSRWSPAEVVADLEGLVGRQG